MKRTIKRYISIVITLTILIGLLPVNALKSMASSNGVATMSSDYITVNVSEKNGGFSVRTVEGDRLNKSDDNKALLYHNGEYDTSFTSFEVTYADGSIKEYLFGGSYGFLGLKSSAVEVVKKSENEISAVWKLDDLTFTQNLTIVSSGANERGMVSISYDVKNSGSSAVSVKARLLLDTALGEQDFGRYQVIDKDGDFRSIITETILAAADDIPQNFYANDDPYNPGITAYTVSKQGQMPYQAAFGHWNNLASSLFSFAPNPTLDFNDPYNKYLTADSAYALYYDLGGIAASGGNSSLLTYYGIYAHEDVALDSTMTVDVTAPTTLSLNSDNSAYEKKENMGIADFSVQTVIKNLMEGQSKSYSTITLAIHTSAGIMPLNAKGEAVPGISYENIDPYTITYADVAEGAMVSDYLYFSAKPANEVEFRKVKLQVYNTSSGATLTADKLLGETVFYILCPGTNGELPKFTFTSLTPEKLYYSGTRHLFLTGTNIDILYTSILSGNCTLKAYSKGDGGQEITISKQNVLQPDKDKLDIILTEDMVTGEWFLQLEWTDNAIQTGIVTADFKIQTAPALTFMVTDDVASKNETYGVVAVVQTAGGNEIPAYRIETFKSETDFQAYKKGKEVADKVFKKEYLEILLELRGIFEVEGTIFDSQTSSALPTKLKATSVKASVDSEATNPITINNCIDFEDGVLTVFYTYATPYSLGDISVLFDGSLYTSDARTSIWKGEAGFTKIVQGKEFSLIPYDDDGERDKNFSANTISLIWPSVYGTAQTIAGMAFNLAYGQLGVMKDKEEEVGRLISFSAKLDLGFLIPSGVSKEEENSYWTRLKFFWENYKESERGEFSDWMYCNSYDDLDMISEEKVNENKGAASVMVQDILYGCGAGFVGVHFKANIAIPNYVEGMPKIEGELEVNTIGNWMVALEGGMELPTFTVKAALTLKSYKNIPVPDKMYLFVSGFEPGINVDGHGVLWITGGGGGFDNLYDTIFAASGIPPLKILLTVSFDIVKALSAQADLSLSLRGFSIAASEVKIKFTNLMALKKASIQLDWYPDLFIMGSISMSLLGIIYGNGYIVLEGKNYEDWFFEAFVRAGVKIPGSIPIVGGMTVGQVDLGLNADKLWGQLTVLHITVGVTYYWGSGLDFGNGATSTPSYPSLLGCEDKPVYYDEETDQTLYMRVGTNLSVAALPEITDNFANAPRLMGASSSLRSDKGRLEHQFNLGISSGSDAIITVNFDATSLEDAKNTADKIIADGIKDKSGASYSIILYNSNNLDEANANVTYDPETKKGSFAFTMTEKGCYEKEWSFTTPIASDIILYDVAAVPEMTSVSGNINGTALDLSWSGMQLDELDSVKYYLVSDKDSFDDGGYPLKELSESTEINSGKTSIVIPSNIPSGDYYIRAVYSKDDVVNGVVNSGGTIKIENSSTPEPFSITQVNALGDYKLGIKLDNPTADAYVVNVYQYDSDSDSSSWVYSDANGVVVEKDKIVDNTLTVGGRYSFTDNPEGTSSTVKGLEAGIDYRIGVTACNYVDTDNDGEPDTHVFIPECFYSSSGGIVTDISSATSVRLPKPAPPVVSVTADKVPVPVSRTVGNKEEIFDTYSSSDLTFTVSADKAMAGTWSLDGENGKTGTVNGSTALIEVTGLTEGDHTIIVKGVGPSGDGFRYTYSFTVDTIGPRLLLSSPTNGSFFNEDGTLTVTGITDSAARFSVFSDGVAACENKSISELEGSINSDGTFSFTVALPNAHSSSTHKVTITASDMVGNTTSDESEVVHGGLSNIKSLEIYADGEKWDNNNVSTSALHSRTYQLSLCALTNSGKSFFLTDEKLVLWKCTAAEGTASVDSDAMLTVGANSIGFVTGSLRVADTGSRTASITFGAESYGPEHSVITRSTLGGSVSGGGIYKPGDTVTLTAITDDGYNFTGWILEGVSVNNTSAKTITFTMPEGNVVATAKFTSKSAPDDDNSGSHTPDTKPPEGPAEPPESTDSPQSLTATQGQTVSFIIPEEVDVNCLVPYYMVDGIRVYVPMSTDGGGKLTFIAPIDGEYMLEERDISFVDIGYHWARDYIKAVAARGLFMGIGNDQFDPDGDMTRAMFVTVLWRLAGNPPAAENTFKDVVPGSYYSEAAAWASDNGLVLGYGNGLFGVDDKITREQMCVIFDRFLTYLGHDYSQTTDTAPFADSHTISTWAARSVEVCRRLGIVNGKDNNLFDPTADATRAECGTMFIRLIKVILINNE